MFCYDSEQRKRGENMDRKSVLEEQIRELQKLQDKNINSDSKALDIKIDNAIKLSEQIARLTERI
jgi:hypothetical protein